MSRRSVQYLTDQWAKPDDIIFERKVHNPQRIDGEAFAALEIKYQCACRSKLHFNQRHHLYHRHHHRAWLLKLVVLCRPHFFSPERNKMRCLLDVVSRYFVISTRATGTCLWCAPSAAAESISRPPSSPVSDCVRPTTTDCWFMICRQET